MGGGSFSSRDYDSGVKNLISSGKSFKFSAAVHASGDMGTVASILDPRELKNGLRESCYAPGFNDATPIAALIDLTGSMQDVPKLIQKDLPKLIDLVTEQGISDHPNVMFIGFDDENVCPRGGMQMSQFEIEASKLIESLNNMVITGLGGGNQGEAYHLALYALARHTRLECFERDGIKGFAFLICDEEPYYDDQDPSKCGTSPEIAKEVFGDSLQAEVSMLDIMIEVISRYHLFVIRPGHTSNGKNSRISKEWRELLGAAGENPQNVIEGEKTEEIIATMAMSIGRLAGVVEDELVDVLKRRGAVGVDNAAASTKAIVPKDGPGAVGAATSTAIVTAENDKKTGRARRSV